MTTQIHPNSILRQFHGSGSTMDLSSIPEVLKVREKDRTLIRYPISKIQRHGTNAS